MISFWQILRLHFVSLRMTRVAHFVPLRMTRVAHFVSLRMTRVAHFVPLRMTRYYSSVRLMAKPPPRAIVTGRTVSDVTGILSIT